MAAQSLDHLRALLDHLDPENREHQLAFFQGVLEAGPDSIRELNGRLPGSRAPIGLRRLAMEASFYFPWPDWAVLHQRVLRYETDHDIFLTGVRALGRLGTAEALAVLRELNGMRQGAEFQETLAEVLSQTDPQEAFNHYLGHLLQGSANAMAANEAARRLPPLLDGGSIGALRTLAQHPDLLVFRHALTLLAHIFTREAAATLEEIFTESHREVLADRELKEALAGLRALPPAAAREAAAAALDALQAAARSAQGAPAELVADFYRDVLAATVEGKPSQLGNVTTQAAEAMHMRSRRLGFAVDATAEGLAELAGRGLIEPARVLELLAQAYRDQTGREGVARALARLAPAGATALEQLVLNGPDGPQRAAAVEVWGAREDPALAPVLLQACRDPLADIADRARSLIGRLPDAEDHAARLLGSQVPADFQLGLQLVAEHRYRDLVPDLLALLQGTDRVELSLQLVEALGAIGSEQAAEPLLAMLHTGAAPRLQTGLAQALCRLASPPAALALCAKAEEIHSPALHVIAVEALAAAHGPGRGPLPAVAGAVLLEQVRPAWFDRNPWPFRVRLVSALQALQLQAPAVWTVLAGLLNEALAEKRSPSALDTDELHQLQAAARDFLKRAG
jgi:hypothetical protein